MKEHMRCPPRSSPTDCPRCQRATATLSMEGVSAVSVTYRCLHCSCAYEVPIGELPEIVRDVILRLLQARGRGPDGGMTLVVH